jgi:hypothetical protein
MPNHDLQNKSFKVPDNLVMVAKGNQRLTYTNMKKMKSELDGKQDKDVGDTELLKWIDKSLDTSRRKVDAPKRARMNIGAEGTKDSVNGERNNFKQGTSKDKANADPTGVRMPKMATTGRQMADNIVSYEAYEKEMANIRYLIEYMSGPLTNKT